VHEKSLRLPQLRIATNHSVSYTWETTGAEVHPQILLKSQILMQDVKNEMSLKTSRVMTVWQQKGSVTFHAKNFKPNGELSLYSNRIIHLEGVIDSKTLKTSLQERPLFSIYYESKLKDEFTRKVLENIPYARRGYVFKNAELKAFFEAKPWYMPDPEYKEAALTEDEKEWLKEVKALKVVN
jgi:hypothetical protein